MAESVATYGKHLLLKSGVVYGGVKINPQMMKLRGGVDVLVATPGRLLDLFSQNAVKFSQVETLVLDEADRMLDLGFSDDIQQDPGAAAEKAPESALLGHLFQQHPRTHRGAAQKSGADRGQPAKLGAKECEAVGL